MAANDTAGINAKEIAFGTDLDDDSDVGLTQLDGGGNTMLKRDIDGKIYANSSPILLGSTQLTVSSFTGYTFVAVEDFGSASGGKQLVLKHSTGTLVTWALNDSWRFSSFLDSVAANDTAGINAKEVAFETDLDEDGDVGL